MNPKLLSISIFIILVMGIVFISGCKDSKAVPRDLEIIYEWGACHMEKGWNTLKINSDGDATLTVEFFGHREYNKYSFTNSELLEIYREGVRNNFFRLRRKHYNSNIRDGWCSELRIKADGREHEVSVSNMDVKQIKRITQKISEILKSKGCKIERYF
ncbi:MAG: hypothetical protein AB1414_12340 [bacterium]